MKLDNPDALSTVLQRLELHAQVYVSGEFCSPWAVDTSGAKHMPFHLVGSGEAWLHTEGGSPVHLKAGDLVFFPHDSQHVIASSAERPNAQIINADSSHNNGSTTHMVCGFFEFKNTLAWPLLEALGPVVVLDLSAMSAAPQVRVLLDLMMGELAREQAGYYAVINHLAYCLFVEVVREQIRNKAVNQGVLAALLDARISRALEAIHNKPSHHWTLQLLAQQAAMGRSSFAKRFHDVVGLPAMQYLLHWRMQDATRLLANSQIPVVDIAEKSGYDSEAAFRKAYKKATGQTPGSVRRGSHSVL